MTSMPCIDIKKPPIRWALQDTYRSHTRYTKTSSTQNGFSGGNHVALTTGHVTSKVYMLALYFLLFFHTMSRFMSAIKRRSQLTLNRNRPKTHIAPGSDGARLNTAGTKKTPVVAEEPQYPQSKWAPSKVALHFARLDLLNISYWMLYRSPAPHRHRKEELFLFAVYTNTAVYVPKNAYRDRIHTEERKERNANVDTYKETKPRRSVKII